MTAKAMLHDAKAFAQHEPGAAAFEVDEFAARVSIAREIA